MLTPEEFETSFITRDEADGGPMQAVGFAPGTFKVLRCRPSPQKTAVTAAAGAATSDREDETASVDATTSPSSSSDTTPPMTAAPINKAVGRTHVKASAR